MRYLICIYIFISSLVVHGQTMIKSLTFESNTRSYRIFIPKSYNLVKKYPLVFNLHGNGSNAEEQEAYSEMNLIADTADFIVVYPDGIGNTWNSGFNIPYDSGTNDVGFISMLIDTLAANYNIDMQRIYSCGMSMGGFMSYRLACELHNRIAAIASVTGLMSIQVPPNCQQQKPVPVLQFHGTSDSTVYYNGNFYHTSVDYTIDWWNQKNNCDSSSIVKNFPDLVNEGSTVTKFSYSICDQNSEVVLYKINNGGHTWPGAVSLPSLGNTNQDIKASVEIWEFFGKHYNSSPASLKNTIQEENIILEFGPNPVKDILTLHLSQNDNCPKGIYLFNTTGKLLSFESISSSAISTSIDFTAQPAGLYFICVLTNQSKNIFKVVKE